MTASEGSLPCVEWGGRRISRLLLGHNPLKGTSHVDDALSREMREWYDPSRGNDVAVLGRAEACGINTVQFGGPEMHALLGRHKAAGGRLQWIATFYDMDADADAAEAELRAILAVDPPPIGIQLFGERTDRSFIENRMDIVHDRLRRLRDTGLLVGVCSHLPQTLDYVESAGWDVDFYQGCFHTVYSNVTAGRIEREYEKYDDADRDRMVWFVQQTSRPCLVFKVLAASRKCATPESVAEALRFAYAHIKPTDVVAVGMWQKYGDQVGENARWVRQLLAAGPVPPASGE
ncbi:MAG: hypothetical protein IMZ66_02920 [Planctomycetes bacterium]|nr:hypothetical protein [Planctomycetota bacterium]